MVIPAMLAAVPLFTVSDSQVAFVSVVCAVLFYTFVLLPEAIKFDFRLDTDHLCRLKMLPISPTKLVLGQLAVPIVLACGFQFAIIVFAGVFRGIPATMIGSALGLTVPLTVLFVALDNLVFLMYPHRPAQEGFEAFLRTVLKFTGKSFLMVLAGAALVVWAPAAAMIAQQIGCHTAPVFFAGIAIAMSTLAAGCVNLVVRSFAGFDLSRC